jgi:putative membrane protein
MSQAPVPFWSFQEVGEFFGMPYRNLVGWMGTGAVFMGVGALFWKGKLDRPVLRSQLVVPLMVYLVNFGFGAAITLVTLDHRFMIPASLGVLLGVIPAIVLWWSAPTSAPANTSPAMSATVSSNRPLEVVSK